MDNEVETVKKPLWMYLREKYGFGNPGEDKDLLHELLAEKVLIPPHYGDCKPHKCG